jgi:hypothetical protein
MNDFVCSVRNTTRIQACCNPGRQGISEYLLPGADTEAPEILNRIYAYTVMKGKIRLTYPLRIDDWSTFKFTALGLTQTCRRMTDEVLPLQCKACEIHGSAYYAHASLYDNSCFPDSSEATGTFVAHKTYEGEAIHLSPLIQVACRSPNLHILVFLDRMFTPAFSRISLICDTIYGGWESIWRET